MFGLFEAPERGVVIDVSGAANAAPEPPPTAFAGDLAHLEANPAFWLGLATTRRGLLAEAEARGDKAGAEKHWLALKGYEERAERAAVTWRPTKASAPEGAAP
jgi:hypothetical protein